MLTVFIASAFATLLSLQVGTVLWRSMVDPGLYYEGRDWFDDPREMSARDLLFYEPVRIEIYDRFEEEFE